MAENNFSKQGGEALDIGDEFDDSEEEDQQQPQKSNQQQFQANNSGNQTQKQADVEGERVENQPFDEAVEVNDSEEIESDEEEDEVNEMNTQARPTNQQQQQTSQTQQVQQTQPKKEEDDEDEEDEKAVPGAYNPADFSHLQVSHEIKECFEYIMRYKPQKIELESKLRPFIPEYIPAVGEVDALLKMPKPDGTDEDLGITVLDEPALNHEDKTVLELKYVQSKNVVRSAPLTVDSIESADKKPKEISRWISSVQDLHKTRPPPTVNYTKNMPEFDVLMQEWNPEMENALKEIQFPGAEIDMQTSEYARLICSMVDIPCHKLQNSKSVVESLHVLFTLFSEFRQNQHFQQQDQTNNQFEPATNQNAAQF